MNQSLFNSFGVNNDFGVIKTDLSEFRPYYLMTWDEQLAEMVDEMNREFCLVLINGTTRVFQAMQGNKRPTFQDMSVTAFKQLFSNIKVQVDSVIKRGRTHAIYDTKANAWLNHPNRKTYMNAVYSPFRTVPDNTLNTWIEEVKEVKAVPIEQASSNHDHIGHNTTA